MLVLKQIKYLCLFILMAFFLVGCKVVAHNDLSEKDINEMVALLRHNQVEAKKVDAGKGMWTLMVPDADLARSLDLLRINGLPRNNHSGLGSVFKKEGMVSTAMEEQARMIYALSEELSSTISHIEGVLTARVHIVMPKLDSTGKQVTAPKASVFVSYRDDVNMQDNIGKIRQLVEHAIPDLQYADIAVTLFPSTADIPLAIKKEKESIDFLSIGLGIILASIGFGLILFLIKIKSRKEQKNTKAQNDFVEESNEGNSEEDIEDN